jgi:hypothetical protein
LPTAEPTAIPSANPTPTPSNIPTPEPTMPGNTALPTSMAVLCPVYEAVNTNNGKNRVNSATCTFFACEENTLLISTCPSRGFGISLSGMSTLTVYDQDGVMMGRNNQAYSEFQCLQGSGCECSEITLLTYPSSDDQCQEYTIEQGCDQNSQCGGRTAIIGFGGFHITSDPDPTPAPTESQDHCE